jgi:hypothetical protein
MFEEVQTRTEKDLDVVVWVSYGANEKPKLA